MLQYVQFFDKSITQIVMNQILELIEDSNTPINPMNPILQIPQYTNTPLNQIFQQFRDSINPKNQIPQ